MEFTIADINLAKGIAEYFGLTERPHPNLGMKTMRQPEAGQEIIPLDFNKNCDIAYCFCYLYRWFNRINGWTGKNTHFGSMWKDHLREMANK